MIKITNTAIAIYKNCYTSKFSRVSITRKIIFFSISLVFYLNEIIDVYQTLLWESFHDVCKSTSSNVHLKFIHCFMWTIIKPEEEKKNVYSLSRVQLFYDHMNPLSRLLCPWDFLGKNTGVSCHFLHWTRVSCFPALAGRFFTTTAPQGKPVLPYRPL